VYKNSTFPVPNLNSETGKLNGVIIHRPGMEIEQMTPDMLNEALFDDILNSRLACREYKKFEDVLKKYTSVFHIEELLLQALRESPQAHKFLTSEIEQKTKARLSASFKKEDYEAFVKHVIEGFQNWGVTPLYNLYFTRDWAVCFNGRAVPAAMASSVRFTEALLAETVLKFHPVFTQGKGAFAFPWTDMPAAHKKSIIPWKNNQQKLEGGDFLVESENIFLIGQGSRTNDKGVLAFINEKKKTSDLFYVITQELPLTVASFIHLDMVFTFLNDSECMVYEPLILKDEKYATRLIKVKNGKLSSTLYPNIIVALHKLGKEYKPLLCGGTNERYQKREQWYSGCNFFALANGKIMGYERNEHTIEQLDKANYCVVSADEILSGKQFIDMDNSHEKAVITIESSELVRGGGGCRCMTMPFSRE
jgi:arginine deiminase